MLKYQISKKNIITKNIFQNQLIIVCKEKKRNKRRDEKGDILLSLLFRFEITKSLKFHSVFSATHFRFFSLSSAYLQILRFIIKSIPLPSAHLHSLTFPLCTLRYLNFA